MKSTGKKSRRQSGIKTGSGILIAALIIAAILFYAFESGYISFPGGADVSTSPSGASVGSAEFHFIDVGQGDAVLIRAPGGDILIDAGPNSAEEELKSYLSAQGVTSFRYVIFTHPHEDHIGGGDMIMNDYDVENVVMTAGTSTAKCYELLLDSIEASDAGVIEAVSGLTCQVGELTLNFLSPVNDNYSSGNDWSAVVRAVWGSTSVMLTGDAEIKTENEILGVYDAGALKCDLLKVGHHGSDTSSGAAWLDAVSPAIAVISCGEDNSYGHPCAVTLDALSRRGITLYRTDLSGSVVFVSDSAVIRPKTVK